MTTTMIIKFQSEDVRRRFLVDIDELIISTDEERDEFERVGYDSSSAVSYAFPDQPYYDHTIPDAYWNYLHILAASQVVNQNIPDSGYGSNSGEGKRLLAKRNSVSS